MAEGAGKRPEKQCQNLSSQFQKVTSVGNKDLEFKLDVWCMFFTNPRSFVQNFREFLKSTVQAQ